MAVRGKQLSLAYRLDADLEWNDAPQEKGKRFNTEDTEKDE
jgi:hypothetical protein